LRTAILDMAPLLTEHAHTPGYYIAACAEPGGRWSGAQVYESRDGGIEYQLIGTLTFETMIGTTKTALAAGTLGETPAGGPFWDNTNTVDVEIAAEGLFGLADATEAQVLAGHNWCRIGTEILGFQEATLLTGTTYRLGVLLRGIRGTYRSVEDGQDAGAEFVYISHMMASALFVEIGQYAVPANRLVKVVPTGSTLADIDAEEVDIEAWNARPFPVRVFDCTIGSTPFDATFTFEHWTRIPHPVGAVEPFELDEPFEEYVLRIYNPEGTTLQRTKTVSARNQTGLRTLRPDQKTFPYPASEQTADGYTPGAAETFIVEIVQGGELAEGQTYQQEVP
jgi:hypothetical protein